MGLSGSQAKLLLLTARLADNELRSQTINNAKMRLATQSAQASDNYISALNDANLMFGNYAADGTSQSQLLTYNSLTAYSSYNNQYGLVNSAGQLLVSESEAEMFKASNGNLNAYLKEHGLEYTTTYFDELGNIENPDYPSPFNVIESSTLKEWYEAYGSYTNSIEAENYEKYFSAYKSASSDLNSACKSVLTEFLQSGTNSPKIVASGSQVSLGGLPTGNVVDTLNYYKNALNNPNNTYSPEFLKNNGFLTDEAAKSIQDEINSFETYSYQETIAGGFTVNRTGVKVTTSSSLSSTTDSSTGNTTYTIDGDVQITVDSSGNVTNVTVPARDELGDPDYKFVNTDGTAYDWNGKALSDVLNRLVCDQYVDNGDGTETLGGTQYYQAVSDSDGKLKLSSYRKYTDGNQLADEINSSINSIYNFIMSDENFSYENFAMALAGQEPSVAGKITVPAELQSIIDAYDVAKTNYLEFIFGKNDPASSTDSFDIINQLIRDSKITGKQLQDVDYVLKLVNGSITDTSGTPLVNAGSVTFSETYETVIKQFVIENMISNTGEPEYAWIDENDKTNKGNADAKAQWYTNLFNRMKQGYKILENGLASSSEWIEFALESGLVRMEQVDKSFNWKSLDYKTCSAITEETSSEASTKAEAEYNRAMKDIDAKDSLYDMQLKNIDTEHSALQTEYETLKSVISKNIDRTFKFNQNG